MLRLVAPQFEHRLFLSATPHNGHTRSFTGLLELLDPVRFTRTSEMTAAMRGRVEDVVVRRLKREINARSLQARSANSEHSKDRDTDPRFCTRHPPTALLLQADPRETAVSTAFDAFRTAVRKLVSAGTRPRRRAGTFAVEILGKRLLSCPTAFAESWNRGKAGVLRPGRRSCGRDGARSGRACGSPGDRRRPGSRAAKGHRCNHCGRVAQELCRRCG